MKPQQKSLAKRLVIVLWVIFATACGSMNEVTPSSAGNNSSTSTPSGDPVSVSNTAQAVKDLNVGDVYQVSFQGSGTTVDMSGIPSGGEYVLAVANLNTSGSSSGIRVSNDESLALDASVSADADEFSDVEARFHEELRFEEESLAALSRPLKSATAGKAMVAQASASATVPNEGDQTRFQVLSSLSGGSKVTVTATAMYVGSTVICYLDQEVMTRNPDDFNRADVRKTCDDFERRVPEERQQFGQESDVDGNGHLIILFTPQINKMGAALGGLITGFFYASDLYDPGMEIIYALVPDSRGIYGGGSVPKDFTLDKLHPSVLVHEFQHAISYNQHVLVRGGQPEDPIINEGLSHLSEDLLGVGSENYARYETYLSRPAAYGLFGGGSPNLGARGASYLFLRYLMEQSSRQDFVSRLLATNTHGVDNLESSFAGTDVTFNQFGQFYLRWMATLILGGRGLSTDPRYSYEPRVRNATTGEWEGICLKCDAEDGRGTVVNGVTMTDYFGTGSAALQPGAAQFYSIRSAPSQLVLSGQGGGNFGAVLVRVK